MLVSALFSLRSSTLWASVGHSWCDVITSGWSCRAHAMLLEQNDRMSKRVQNYIPHSPGIGFLPPFGDVTFWNILVSGVVLPYISPYSRMTNRMLWGHILSVAPQTSSMEGGARFHLDTRHHCPDPLVTGCHAPAP